MQLEAVLLLAFETVGDLRQVLGATEVEAVKREDVEDSDCLAGWQDDEGGRAEVVEEEEGGRVLHDDLQRGHRVGDGHENAGQSWSYIQVSH
jgi:hypothetical protein